MYPPLRLASTSAGSLWRPCDWVCGVRSWSRSPLSSFAKVSPGALEPRRANHCRVAARLSDFLVVAASSSFLLIPLSLKLAASVWVRVAWARGFRCCCRMWVACSRVLALGREGASLGVTASGSGQTGLALPVDLGRLFQAGNPCALSPASWWVRQSFKGGALWRPPGVPGRGGAC